MCLSKSATLCSYKVLLQVFKERETVLKATYAVHQSLLLTIVEMLFDTPCGVHQIGRGLGSLQFAAYLLAVLWSS
jgi:hypothetical protein